MNKDNEAEMVDSKEKEVDLTMEMTDLTILCKKKENLNGRMKIKTRQSGKVVIPIEAVLVPTEEEISNVGDKFLGKCYRCGGEGHRSFECKSYGENVGRNVVIQGESKQPQCDLEAKTNFMIKRTLCNKEVSKEPTLRRSIFKTKCNVVEKC